MVTTLHSIAFLSIKIPPLCTEWFDGADTSCYRGEQTANALEDNLSKLESKLDELLASFEDSAKEAEAEDGADATTNEATESNDAHKDHGKKSG